MQLPRPSPCSFRFGLQRTRHAWVPMSALPPKAAATMSDSRVRFGPNADIERIQVPKGPKGC